MSDLISTDAPFSETQQQVLRVIVDFIIPASETHGVPSANDDHIFSDIIGSLIPDEPAVAALGTFVDQLVASCPEFLQADAETQHDTVLQIRDQHRQAVTALVTVTGQCYYRDDRVMQSLGMQPRPPFPQGYSVEAGNWSLLDPVRERGEIYRRT